MEPLQPRPPRRLNEFAARILERLRGQPAAAHIIIGGGVALQHYCPSWSLWRQKNPDQNISEAKSRVLYHLEQISSRRPLETLTEPAARERAERVRTWVRDSLCAEGP
jgi:hypothetical protein